MYYSATDAANLTLDVEPDIRNHRLSTNDLFIKDAFLVFRAICKLTMKPVTSERYDFCYYCRFINLSPKIVNAISSHTPCVQSF